jgi:hypothetical protein
MGPTPLRGERIPDVESECRSVDRHHVEIAVDACFLPLDASFDVSWTIDMPGTAA